MKRRNRHVQHRMSAHTRSRMASEQTLARRCFALPSNDATGLHGTRYLEQLASEQALMAHTKKSW